MACLQMARSGLSPVLVVRSGRPKLRVSSPDLLPFRCRVQEDDEGSKGKEPPESLFVKELKRRGMNPTSLDREGGLYGRAEKEMEVKEESGGGSRGPMKRNGVVSAEYEKSVLDQRERSMALNSEGLEGLIPRARLLLTIGGTFFLGFWPLILIIVAFFSALFFYFGPSFVHDAIKTPISPPPYIDPYALLEDERISQIAPQLK